MSLPLKTEQVKKPVKIDFRLMIDRLEKSVLDGRDEDKTKSILMSEEIWKKLNSEQMLNWASLCQMAGCIDTADKIYDEIHKKAPLLETAWERHMEMIDLLGRKPRLVKLLETARRSLPQDVYTAISKRFSGGSVSYAENEISRAGRPFEQLRTHQVLADQFLRMFAGRQDCFARQWFDKASGKSGYVPVRHSMRHHDLEAHFKGYETCGIYLIHPDDSVRVAVIDADLAKKARDIETFKKSKSAIAKESQWMSSRLIDISREVNMRPCIEISGGKGFHYWYFFSENISAARARALLNGIANRLSSDLEYFNLEVFPKQDRLTGRGFGNLVKLPLGIHRKTGKRSWFVECPDRDVDAQLSWFTSIKPDNVENIKDSFVPEKGGVVSFHPKFTVLSEKYPDLAVLSSACPPLGRLITACFSGTALSSSEEQVLYQTIGFLPQASMYLHALFGAAQDYNQHMVDLKLSKLRGTPLGCRRIHSITGYTGDLCPFPSGRAYPTPVLHLGIKPEETGNRSEKIETMQSALKNLRTAIEHVERFIS